MFIIVPLLAFYLIFLIFYKGVNSPEELPSLRNAFLAASVVWGVILVAITEFLSLLSLIVFNWILFSWGLVCVASFLIYSKLRKQRNQVVKPAVIKLPLPETLLLLFIGAIVLTTGLIAFQAPPNTWDSIVYHMSRVLHWIQNHNVGCYPTHIMQQVSFGPGAEFTIMHFQILTGGDRFANFVQFLSFIGSIVGVSLIAKQFGASIRDQIFSVVLCVTIPMGILQASSTQNDYVVGFWLTCFVYYVLLILKKGARHGFLLLAGSSLGLAFLTKGTAYLYAPPFLAWLAFSGFKKFRWRSVLIIILISLSINIGYFKRNCELYNSPFVKIGHVTTGMPAPLFISNAVRNIALHLGMPIKKVNKHVFSTIKLIHAAFGIDINDSRSTAEWPFEYIPFSFSEDEAGNSAHLFLILGAMIIFLMSRRKIKEKTLIPYAAALIGAFLIFCFYVKFTPWNQRYHLPIFVLFCPFVATVLSEVNNYCNRNKIVLTIIGLILLCPILDIILLHRFSNTLFAILLILFFAYRFRDIVITTSLIFLLMSLPWLLHSEFRPLIGKQNIFTIKRNTQYFTCWPEIKDLYAGAVDYIKSKKCSNIGIILGEEDYEYPIIVLLKEGSNSAFRIEHVNVDNASSIKYDIYPFNDFNPNAIIYVGNEQKDRIFNKNNVYIKEWSSGFVSVFMKP